MSWEWVTVIGFVLAFLAFLFWIGLKANTSEKRSVSSPPPRSTPQWEHTDIRYRNEPPTEKK